jgi:NAD(P)-dependent dehydrogenase (short-subunit alcohol dehydrogenase family)
MDSAKVEHTLRVVSATCKLLLGSSSYSFKDKVVLITGGSRGLGLVLSRQLADQGARLALLARDQAELQRAADELRAHGSEVLTCAGDVSIPEQARGAVEATVARFGRLDVLINDAGIIQVGPLQHMQREDFASALGVHFWGPLHTMLAAIPHLRRGGGGRILNIASIGGKIPIPQLAPYCASKFALVGLSSALRTELLRDNILLTTACPWLMRTGSHYNAQFKGQNKKTFTEFAIADSLPLLTVSAERAARQILRACQRGRAELIVGFQARLLYRLSTLLPETFSAALSLVGQLMPGPIGPEGNVSHTGWESETVWAPSLLTRLADQAAARNNELKDHPKPA